MLLAIVLAVLLLFLWPMADLPETALRAKQIAANVLLSISAFHILLFIAIMISIPERRESRCHQSISNALLCTLLC